MIEYNLGRWGIGISLQIRGSVLPKVLFFAVPNAIFSVVMFLLVRIESFKESADVLPDGKGISLGISGYTAVLGFLLVFRTQQAYSRWWEGCSLLLTCRGEWFNAYSNLLAFCTRDASRQIDVEKFQHLLVRLMSMLYASALMQVSTVEDVSFNVIDLTGCNQDHLQFLVQQHDRVEVLLQWIQQSIVDRHKDGVLDIAPPILSRVFQELGRGMVNITNARKISDCPFPFPYIQLLTYALLLQWMTTPVLMSLLCDDVWWAGILSFLTTTFMWGIHYVAQEIEEPFGCDQNDLPLHDMQHGFNVSLASLLMRFAKTPPPFEFDPEEHCGLRVTELQRGAARRRSIGGDNDDPSTTKELPMLLADESVGRTNTYVKKVSSDAGKRNKVRGFRRGASLITLDLILEKDARPSEIVFQELITEKDRTTSSDSKDPYGLLPSDISPGIGDTDCVDAYQKDIVSSDPFVQKPTRIASLEPDFQNCQGGLQEDNIRNEDDIGALPSGTYGPYPATPEFQNSGWQIQHWPGDDAISETDVSRL